MRRKRWIKASLLTMIAAAPVVGMLTAIRCVVAAQDPPSVQQLLDLITSDNSTSPQREEAAILLINRHSPDAENEVNAILKGGNSNGQIAVARALTKAANPNPAFIEPLGILLGSNHSLNEAVAAALANCDGQPGVFDALLKYADNPANSNIDRNFAIRAMGSVVQETTANYLIDLINVRNQNASITNAATDALTDLTGITTYGNDTVVWTKWWNSVKGKNADQFRSAVLATRDLRVKLTRQHETQLVSAVNKHLEQNFRDLLRENKKTAEAALLGYLNDPMPEIRYIGVDLVEQFTTDTDLVASVRPKLLKMIDDGDDNVRLSVVGVLLNLSDQAALPLLIARVDVEKNMQVKAKIAQTLGKLGDLSAAATLIKLLDDAQPEIVTAGAKALSGEFGKKLHDSDTKRAESAAAKLRQILTANDGQPGTEDLKAACLSALAALRDKLALEIFRSHVVPAQPAEVRRAALLGLENLGDETTDETVAGQLQLENDATVRLKAAEALRTVATPAQLETIIRYMKEDPDVSVRNALWIALSQKLYPKLKPDDLSRIADDLNDDPNHSKDPDKTRRLYTLQKLVDAYAAKKDGDKVAQYQQTLADAMLAVSPPRTQEAIDNLKMVLDYLRGKGNGELESIIGQLLDAELKARQWDAATKFASDQIKFDPAYQQTVGTRIKSKIDEMINGDHPDLDSAKTLIDAALKMEPKLDVHYLIQIQDLQGQLKAKAAGP